MATSGSQHDEDLARMNAQGEWASNLAWGFAALSAVAALLLWALFGSPGAGQPHLDPVPAAGAVAK